MNKRWTLKILNARSAYHTWSKQRVLYTIFALVISSIMALPSAAQAKELSSNALAAAAVEAFTQAQTHEQKVDVAKAAAAPAADKAVAANAVAEKHVAAPAAEKVPAAPVAAPADKAPAAPVDQKPAAKAPAVPVAPDAPVAAPADKAPVTPVAAPVDKAPAAAAAAAAAAADNKPADANNQPAAPAANQPVAPAANAANAAEPPASAPAQPQAKPALDPEKYQDSLGTTLEFDWNNNGSTSKEDWLAFRTWLSTYTPVQNGGNAEGGNTAMGAINIKVNKPDEGDVSLTPGVDVSKVKQYYLANVDQLTPSRNQGSLGTCWAHAIMGELESAMLKKRAGDQGMVIDEAQHKEPKLSGVDSKLDFSELYLALKSYTLQKEGSQAGEGVVPINMQTGKEDPTTESLNLGGFTDFDETLLTNWDGVVSEKLQPYWPKDVPFTRENRLKVLAGLMSIKGTDRNDWNLTMKDTHPEAPVHVDGVYYLPAVNHYAIENKQMVWKGRNPKAVLRMKEALVKYGALQFSLNMGHSAKQFNNEDSNQQNHAVLVVGWNDEYPADGFGGDAAPGKGAWLVKNSWGSRDYVANQVKQLKEDYKMSDKDFADALSKLPYMSYIKRNKKSVYSRLKQRFQYMVEDDKAKDPATLTDAQKAQVKHNAEQLAKYTDRLANFDKNWAQYLASDYETGETGSGWGLPDNDGFSSGYFWVSYYDKSYTGAQALSVDLKDDGFDYDNNYSYNYSYAGTTTPFELRTTDTTTLVSNVFSAKGTEILKAVSARSTQAGSHVNVKVYLVSDADLKDSDPTNDGVLVSEQNYVTTAAGFETIKLSTPVQLSAGTKFAVVENITGEVKKGNQFVKNAWLSVETGLSQSAQDPNNGKLTDEGTSSRGLPMQYLWTFVKSNPGETFIRLKTKDGEKWLTPQQLTAALCRGDAFEFGNAFIKAFTVNGRLPVVEVDDEKPAPQLQVVETLHALVNDAKTFASTDLKQYAYQLAELEAAAPAAPDAAAHAGVEAKREKVAVVLKQELAGYAHELENNKFAPLLADTNPDAELKAQAAELVGVMKETAQSLAAHDVTGAYVANLLTCSRMVEDVKELYAEVVGELAFAQEHPEAVNAADKEVMQKRLAYVKALLKYYALLLKKRANSLDAQYCKNVMSELASVVKNDAAVQQYLRRLADKGFARK